MGTTHYAGLGFGLLPDVDATSDCTDSFGREGGGLALASSRFNSKSFKDAASWALDHIAFDPCPLAKGNQVGHHK
jgi:hypothetical protein